MNKLLFILLLAAILRFWQLGTIPLGITHDEMGYIYNAYSIAETGRNVFNQQLPLFTWMTQGGFPFMPVPIYAMVPLFWILPLTPFISRLLPALMGVADVALLYFIIKKLFSRSDLALVSALFLAISPWHLHFARSAYDANFALFFYLAGIAYLVNRQSFLSILTFFLAIFSYRGMSILFLPIMLALYWYGQKRSLHYILGMCFCMFMLLVTILTNGPGYTKEGTQLLSNTEMQAHIDTQIREAKGPLLVRRIFANKPIYIIDKFRENYTKAYSPEFLFLYTEPSAIYSIWSRGRIYFIDVFFIILGFAYLFRVNKNAALLWTSFLLIGGIPGGIGGLPYSSRNFFLSAIFPVLSAAGVLYLIRGTNKIILVSIIIVYTYAFGSYLHDYYNRYAYYGAEGWAKSIKDISLLAHQKKNNYEKVYLANTSFADVVEYAFWNQIEPKFVQNVWENRTETSFTLDSVTFSNVCLEANDWDSRNAFYISNHDCKYEATPSGKITDFYGNTVWNIYSTL